MQGNQWIICRQLVLTCAAQLQEVYIDKVVEVVHEILREVPVDKIVDELLQGSHTQFGLGWQTVRGARCRSTRRADAMRLPKFALGHG